jgi:hypothetical protein
MGRTMLELATFSHRIDALLAERPSAEPSTIEELYTDGCAELLSLGTRRLRTTRRMRAAMLDAHRNSASAREARELLAESEALVEQEAELRELLDRLRAALTGRF